jgi:glycogen phosphorylase
VNGVAKLHTRLLKEKIFKSFHQFFPGKFNSKTNGITPRRWLLKANPLLAELITGRIGDGWITNLTQLQLLEPYAEDVEFQKKWRIIKGANKKRLAELIQRKCGLEVNLDSLFDIQVKRIHEYKRQLLNCLHIISHYHKILRRPDVELVPRTIIFAGKAAPTYWKAKLVIKLINSIAEVVNNDPRVGNRLRVAFLPNYNVSQAEVIIPGADLSEQISTAGTEASGTGNMKFALNGALTIGTLDGANIEILEEVGQENIFIFGMTAEEAEYEKLNVSRTPMSICEKNEEIAQIIDSLRNGSFSRGDRELFRPLVDSLLDQYDPYLLLLDLESYLACQDRVNTAFIDPVGWTRMSILNVARMGKFSTDRTIRQYATEIWDVPVDEED